jgi:TonB family protein
MAGLAEGQSGRVKNAPSKPTVAPVPVEKPETPAEKPKKTEFPKIVDGERIYLGTEVDSKAVILKKPEPDGTSEAKRHRFHGMAVIHAILAASGHVTNITIIKGLPYGLDKKSIEAALLIKFRPATKDGEFVSEWVRIEYEFWFV